MKSKIKKVGRQKGCIPWNKGIPRTEEVKRKISVARKGKTYSNQLKNLEKGRGWNKGIKHTKETIEKMSQSAKNRVGEKNANWKGDDVGYSGIHAWIKLKMGFPNTCEHCGKFGLKGKQIHWANKNHKYKRDIDDWIRLCASCHKNYDFALKNV